MRCPRCGNENPATNRFCGMCGATMLAAPAAANPPASAPIPPRPVAVPPAAPKPVQPAPRPAPPPPPSLSISGPSFLGLNQPPEPTGRPSADPRGGPSRNLDYLLDDDEPQHGGGWKIGLILVALLLAVGMGYLRWRNQGFGWLGAVSKKPSASQTTDNSATPTSNSSSDSTTTANPSAAPAQPAPDASASSNPAGTAPKNAPAPASSDPTPNATPPAAADPAPPTPAPTTPTSDVPAKPTSKPTTVPKAAAPQDADDADADQPPARKPAAGKPLKPSDPVSEAQKYLYGKGAAQSCARGMKLLKPAADRGNPKAMSQMGTLYSAGLCAPKDLPTAYRWFALALRKSPDDQVVQSDMQKVWGEMTQPERQLAIRLSQ